MATDFPDAAAAPVEDKMGELPVRLTPLKFGDYAYWDRWAKAEFLTAVRMMDDADRDSDAPLQRWSEPDRRACWAQAMDVAARITFGGPKALALVISREGKMRIVWLSIRHEHPKLTMADLWAYGLCDQEELNRVWSAVLEISGMATKEDDGKDMDPTKVAAVLEAQL